MLDIETRRISEVTAKPVEEFSKKTEGREPYVYEMKKTNKGGKCVFLKENLCTIYAIRPLICRFYPFELKTQKNGKYVFTDTAECPGIGKGKRLQKVYFENLLQQLNALSDYCKKN
jgi:Fe-S-cluster containining protein